ncbi:MAG: ABC-three component system protein [Candidatus Paceibacterota bacterium]
MSNFSAKDSALGYLYQARYALYEIIKQNKAEDAKISIEGLDDFDLKEEGYLTLSQLKHHLKTPANLQNSSPDLWKTIRIWIENYQEDKIELSNTTFYLITTGKILSDSIAHYLLDGNSRDVIKAIDLLDTTCKTSENKALKKSFEAYKSLDLTEKRILFENVIVRGEAKNIEELGTLIKRILEYSVDPLHTESAFKRLEGWWNSKVVEILLSGEIKYIQRIDVLEKIRSISKQFAVDNLPIDYLGAKPPTHEVIKFQNEIFVEQLRSISVGADRIRNCIYDYYRAYSQRNDWILEDLLADNDLELYEGKLIQEWDRLVVILKDTGLNDTPTEQDLVNFGKKVLQWVELNADFKIRDKVEDLGYVMRGSFHMLANEDKPRVYWHPEFLERLVDSKVEI